MARGASLAPPRSASDWLTNYQMHKIYESDDWWY